MKSINPGMPYETAETGTPLDYAEDLYRFYFEVGEHNHTQKIKAVSSP